MPASKSCACTIFAVFFLFTAVVSIFRFTAWKLERRQRQFRSVDRGDSSEDESLLYRLRVGLVRSQLQQYIQVHSAAAVLADPQICMRQFVLAGYPSADMLGETTFELLNGFAASIIFNRTLVGVRPSRSAAAPWKSGWMIDLSDLRAAWRVRGCSGRMELAASVASALDVTGMLACCGNDTSGAAMISTCIRGHTLHQLRAVTGTNSGALVPSFRHDVIGRLFSVDPYTSYGLLLRASLQIPPTRPRVIAALSQIEGYHTTRDMVVFGVHLRHRASLAVLVQEEVDAALSSLSKIVPVHTQSGALPCAVVLASNRREIFGLAKDGYLMGCRVTRVEPLEASAAHDDAEEQSANSLLDDISLLSLSDVFLGSKSLFGEPSSVSLLIADLIASDHKKGSQNIYWIGNVAVSDSFEAHSLRSGAEEGSLLSSAQCTLRSFCDADSLSTMSCPRLLEFEVAKPAAGTPKGTVMLPGKKRADGRPVYYNPKYDFRNRTSYMPPRRAMQETS